MMTMLGEDDLDAWGPRTELYGEVRRRYRTQTSERRYSEFVPGSLRNLHV